MKRFFAEILQEWLFGEKERENAFAALHFKKSVFWPTLINTYTKQNATTFRWTQVWWQEATILDDHKFTQGNWTRTRQI